MHRCGSLLPQTGIWLDPAAALKSSICLEITSPTVDAWLFHAWDLYFAESRPPLYMEYGTLAKEAECRPAALFQYEWEWPKRCHGSREPRNQCLLVVRFCEAHLQEPQT